MRQLIFNSDGDDGDYWGDGDDLMIMLTMQRRTAMRQTITQTGKKALSM